MRLKRGGAKVREFDDKEATTDPEDSPTPDSENERGRRLRDLDQVMARRASQLDRAKAARRVDSAQMSAADEPDASARLVAGDQDPGRPNDARQDQSAGEPPFTEVAERLERRMDSLEARFNARLKPLTARVEAAEIAASETRKRATEDLRDQRKQLERTLAASADAVKFEQRAQEAERWAAAIEKDLGTRIQRLTERAEALGKELEATRRSTADEREAQQKLAQQTDAASVAAAKRDRERLAKLEQRAEQAEARTAEMSRRLDTGFGRLTQQTDAQARELVQVQQLIGPLSETVGSLGRELADAELRSGEELRDQQQLLERAEAAKAAALKRDRERVSRLERRLEQAERRAVEIEESLGTGIEWLAERTQSLAAAVEGTLRERIEQIQSLRNAPAEAGRPAAPLEPATESNRPPQVSAAADVD